MMSTSRSEAMLSAIINDMMVVSLVGSIIIIVQFLPGLNSICQSRNDHEDMRSVRLSAEPMATIRIHIIPNAKIDKVVGERGDAIRIKLRASALEGKANAALRSFLAEELNISQR